MSKALLVGEDIMQKLFFVCVCTSFRIFIAPINISSTKKKKNLALVSRIMAFWISLLLWCHYGVIWIEPQHKHGWVGRGQQQLLVPTNIKQLKARNGKEQNWWAFFKWEQFSAKRFMGMFCRAHGLSTNILATGQNYLSVFVMMTFNYSCTQNFSKQGVLLRGPTVAQLGDNDFWTSNPSVPSSVDCVSIANGNMKSIPCNKWSTSRLGLKYMLKLFFFVTDLHANSLFLSIKKCPLIKDGQKWRHTVHDQTPTISTTSFVLLTSRDSPPDLL